jgi:hypothetical protein
MKKARYKVVTSRNESAIVDYIPALKLSYDPGKTVKAKKNTTGITVFKTKKQAMDWVGGAKDRLRILRVVPIGEKQETRLFNTTFLYRNIKLKTADLLDYAPRFLMGRFEVPEGTECYPAVKVLT